MNSRGTTPPEILSSNTTPSFIFSSSAAASSGVIGMTVTTASPNWPRPPVCFLKRPRTSFAMPVMVSRYETRGLPTFTPIFMSRVSLFLMISRWSSPMPAMMVSPVSSL